MVHSIFPENVGDYQKSLKSNKMKIVITGIKGELGKNIAKFFESRNFEVGGYSSKPEGQQFKLDFESGEWPSNPDYG